MTVIVDRSHYFGIVGGLYGKRSASVECLVEGYHTATSIVERCQFKRIFVSLGARIDEEQLIIVVSTGFAKQVGKALLQAIDYRVAVEHQIFGLMLESLHIVRMRVSHRYHGMSAVKVEILGAFAIVGVATHAFHYFHIEQWIYIK